MHACSTFFSLQMHCCCLLQLAKACSLLPSACKCTVCSFQLANALSPLSSACKSTNSAAFSLQKHCQPFRSPCKQVPCQIYALTFACQPVVARSARLRVILPAQHAHCCISESSWGGMLALKQWLRHTISGCLQQCMNLQAGILTCFVLVSGWSAEHHRAITLSVFSHSSRVCQLNTDRKKA
jgi:hypothetical protein